MANIDDEELFPETSAFSELSLQDKLTEGVIRRDDGKSISVGDRLLLKKISRNDKLIFCANIELEIKWIQDVQYLGLVGIGSRFKDIPDNVREKIDKFVDSAC